MEIEERNRIRSKAGLPLLNLVAEKTRLAVVQRDADFERYWNKKIMNALHTCGPIKGGVG